MTRSQPALRWLSLLVLAAFSLTSAACPAKSDDDGGAKKETKKKKKKSSDGESEETEEEEEAEASAKPTATATEAAPAPTPTPAPAPTPAPTPTETAAPAPSAPARSAQPADTDWATATDTTIVGLAPTGCEAKEIREWVRIHCKGTDATRGVPTGVIIDSGSVENETITPVAAGTSTLIYSFVDGRNVKATFLWAKQKRGFTAEWPAGTAKPASKGTFNPTAETIADTTYNPFAINCRSDAQCGAGKRCCVGVGSNCMASCTGTSRHICNSDQDCARLRGARCMSSSEHPGFRTCRVVRDSTPTKEPTPSKKDPPPKVRIPRKN